MKTIHYLFLSLGLFLLAGLIVHKIYQPVPDQTTLFEDLQQVPMTEIVLKSDMKKLLSKPADDNYQPAEITFLQGDTTQTSYSIEVKPRGVTRKKICDFPPLKFKFAKEDLTADGMAPYSKLKLVTHCHEGEDFEQVLLKEYMAYKMYNVLTEKSFKVQLVQITYVDANSELPSSTHYGFLLENKKELADRLQAKLMDKDQEPLKRVDAHQYQLFALFQYMIGNTDWNLSKQHNIKLMVADEKYGPFPVPYDFDYAGLVNAPYAKPYPSLPIKNVKERFFQFRGKRSTNFDPIYDLFNSKKSEILGLCNNLDLLNESVKKEMRTYLLSFFELIEEPKVANQQLSLGQTLNG